MNIQLSEEDLEKAVKDYLKTIISKSGQDFVINFNYESCSGRFSADVIVVNAEHSENTEKPKPIGIIYRKSDANSNRLSW